MNLHELRKLCQKVLREDLSSGISIGTTEGDIFGGNIGYSNTDFYAPGDNRRPGLLFKKPIKRNTAGAKKKRKRKNKRKAK